MPVYAMGLVRLLAVAAGVAGRAHCLDVVMMAGLIAEMMVVLVPALTFRPYVAAVSARQIVGVMSPPSPDLYVDPLSRLLLVPIAWRVRRRAA